MKTDEEYIEWIQNIINGYNLGQTHNHKIPSAQRTLEMIGEVIEKHSIKSDTKRTKK